jgi:penicillin V acylase-like amidase (Ntn superfamily)
MKTKIRFLVSLILLSGWGSLDGNACTTFCLKEKNGNLIFGKNFDFPVGRGQIHINRRNQRKTSFITAPEKSLTWNSRYGSMTFNQNGREFPYGGMNEAGLVLEQMMHENAASKYPAADNRYGLEELQWIQYQLDVSASVADVIASDQVVRISFTSTAPLHFLVADAAGSVAAIEYVGGKMVVHTGPDLKYPVLANETYDVSSALKTNLAAAGGKTHPDRFVRAASLVEAFDRGQDQAVEYAFGILKNVSQAGTQWSIVYDLKNKAIRYRTRDTGQIRLLELSGFDFSCMPAGLLIDIEAAATAVTDFKAYDFESNLKLINDVWSQVDFLKRLPQESRISRAKYPETVTCGKMK